MELGKGWKQWDVSLDFIPTALTHLKENGVKEYIIVPVMREEDKAGRKYCYNIFFYNEKDSITFINGNSQLADSVTFEPLVMLRPLIMDYIQKKEAYYKYCYSKECDSDKLDELNNALDTAEAILLKKVCELGGAT
jgi:hypothetical protein